MWQLLTGVEDGLGGNEGQFFTDVKGGEWNNLFEGDKLGEDDLLIGVDLNGNWPRLTSFDLEIGGEVADEDDVTAGMAGGMDWWTGVVTLLKF